MGDQRISNTNPGNDRQNDKVDRRLEDTLHDLHSIVRSAGDGVGGETNAALAQQIGNTLRKCGLPERYTFAGVTEGGRLLLKDTHSNDGTHLEMDIAGKVLAKMRVVVDKDGNTQWTDREEMPTPDQTPESPEEKPDIQQALKKTP